MSFPALVPAAPTTVLPAWMPPMLSSVLLHVALIAAVVARFGGDASALICVPDRLVGHPPFEHVKTGRGVDGYDGQFEYAAARSPLKADAPRLVRPLYSVVCWSLAAGDARRLTFVMPAVNLAAIALMSLLGSMVALKFHRSAWWGFWLPLVLNVGTAAMRDLPDPVAACTAVALLSAYLLRARAVVLALTGLLAVLSRDAHVPLVVMLMAGLAWQRRWDAVAGLSVAVAAWVGWFSWVSVHQGQMINLFADSGIPWRVLPERIAGLVNGPMTRSTVIHLAGLAAVAAPALMVLLMMLRRSDVGILAAGLIGLGLMALAPSTVWADGHAYTRLFMYVPLAVWCWCVHSGRTWPIVALLPLSVWPMLAAVQVWQSG